MKIIYYITNFGLQKENKEKNQKKKHMKIPNYKAALFEHIIKALFQTNLTFKKKNIYIY